MYSIRSSNDNDEDINATPNSKDMNNKYVKFFGPEHMVDNVLKSELTNGTVLGGSNGSQEKNNTIKTGDQTEIKLLSNMKVKDHENGNIDLECNISINDNNSNYSYSADAPRLIKYKYGRNYKETIEKLIKNESQYSFDKFISYFVTKNLYFGCLQYEVCIYYVCSVVGLMNVYFHFDNGQKWCNCLIPFLIADILIALRMGNIIKKLNTLSKIVSLACSVITYVELNL